MFDLASAECLTVLTRPRKTASAAFALPRNSDEQSDCWRSTSLLDDDREISICELLEWDEEIVPRFGLADIPDDFGSDGE